MEARIVFAKTSPVVRNISIESIEKTGTSSRAIRDDADTRHELIEKLEIGAWFVDCTPIPHDIFARGVITGPLLDIRQTERHVGLEVSDTAESLAQGAFKTLAKAQRKANRAGTSEKTPGPLDTLSPEAFAAFWRELGAITLRKTANGLRRVTS